MGKALLRFTLLLVLAGLLAYGLTRQRLTGDRLRSQLQSLRAQAATTAELARENARLRAGQLSPAELARLRRIPLGAKARSSGDGPPPAPAGIRRVTAEQWRLAGRATPPDTFESVVWAATHQDIDTLAGFLGFDEEARKQAEALFAKLPEDVRQKYGSPERIAATMLAANTPSNLSALSSLARTESSGDQATMLMRVERSDGTQKDNFFKFQKGEGGWKLLVPEAVMQSYAGQLTGDVQLPSPKGAQ